MKIHSNSCRRAANGYALLISTVFAGVGLAILGSSLQWASTNAKLTDRNNKYFKAVAAAEAATEGIIAEMADDFEKGGSALVASRMNLYRAKYPRSSEHPDWENYRFNDAQGQEDKTYIAVTAAETNTILQSTYRGLRGMASSYRIVSNARDVRDDITAAVRQDIQIATIPLFQFAIFYSLDLEIHPGPNMNITGRVHGNRNIYTKPGATLTFFDDVTAVGSVEYNKKAGDGVVRNGNIQPVYQPGVEVTAPANSLTLPVGDSNNSPASVHAILEIPPASESTTSLLGKQRYYNKAAMTVVVSNGGIEIRKGVGKGHAVLTNFPSGIVITNKTSFDKRENKTLKLVEIDVAKLKTYSESSASSALGAPLDLLYVADVRTTGANELGAVRLVNGKNLPDAGLTVATPNPLYVKGDYNAPPSSMGTDDTSDTKPASLVADAINILSGDWNDSNAGSNLGSRVAKNTTVNAAFLAGIVETSASNGSGPGKGYSGGVENFPRFLENWSGKTFTYNGSMVVLFPSQKATAPWKGTGTTGNVYEAPTRKWAFDVNFLDPTKLPPGTPSVRTLVRNDWAVLPKDSVN